MATTRNQLSYGSEGSEVTELQKLLNKSGYGLDEDGIFGEKTQSAVRDYQQKNNLDVDGIVGNNTWGALTKAATASTAASAKPAAPKTEEFKYDAYQESDTVKQAQALLQQQLSQKPGAYQSPWQSQLNDTMDKILNREKFSYDLNGDALYQQYKDLYTTQGQMAMMDTMGQAQAMTGGYGNSYAQSVGQQAYQGHLQQLNDKIPELYQLALNKYQMEGQDLQNQFSMLGAREDQEYGRYRDTVSDWNSEVDRLQGQYNAERDYDYGKWSDNRDFGYGQYRDTVADQQWQDAFQYQQGRDEMADSQWQKEFDEAVRQFNFANKLGEFAPVASADGGGGGSSGGNWLNSDGSVNVKHINTNTDWWRDYASSNGLDPNTGKHITNSNPNPGKSNPTANDLLDGIINTSVKSQANDQRNIKSQVNQEINNALKAGAITAKEAHDLKQTYNPRGYTY